MLLDDDVVTERKTEAGPFAGRLGRKERVEHLFLDVTGNAGPVVADSDFDTVAEVLSRGSKRWFVAASISLRFALRGCIEAVGNQIKQHPGNLLREQINLTGGRVKILLQGDIEALLLGPRPMIGEIEALLDQGVDIDRPVLSGPLTRM